MLRRCLWITGAGAVAGIVLAGLVTRLMRSLLFGVEPLDAATLAGAVPALLATALLAAYLPARRAARVDPLTSLKVE